MELLVVLAIILLLVAIVLPALGKARDAAMLTKCGSNLRQQGIAVYGYINDSRDFLPYAAWWGSDDNWTWDDLIDPYLGERRTVEQRKSGELDIAYATEVLTCARDPHASDSIHGIRSYSMTRVSHDHTGEDVQGVADISRDGLEHPPQQFRLGVEISAPSGTFMIAERSARSLTSPGLQGHYAFAEIDGPRQQMPGENVQWYLTDASAGGAATLLHGSRSRPLCNYLFVDGHVEVLTPMQTLGTATAPDKAKGPWTRSPHD